MLIDDNSLSVTSDNRFNKKKHSIFKPIDDDAYGERWKKKLVNYIPFKHSKKTRYINDIIHDSFSQDLSLTDPSSLPSFEDGQYLHRSNDNTTVIKAFSEK